VGEQIESNRNLEISAAPI